MKEFVNELLIRFFADKPQFFKVVQLIGVMCAAITGLPLLFEAYGFILPEAIEKVASQTISVSSMVATFIAQFTVTSSVKKKKGIND